jgi:hypothetical protein
MQSIELKQDMSRGDEFRFWISPRCVRSQRVITREVRMHYIDTFASHKPVQLMRALHVERISQWECDDAL